ncbi:MAG: Eco57I restriction-modification methylase domain-containing protein, partial [Bacteroidales bacterium]|nr:Eco57I restriction-modification methylase domain-containing protein [Bacteroidales bacterium]
VDSESSSDSSTNTKKEKKKYNSLWTQKFGKRKITDNNDLRNVINYIRTNRKKHELPENKKLEKTINKMTCSIEHALRTEYNGGFDVVIGNPPYVRQELLGNFKPFFEKNYAVYEGTSDLFAYFYEKALQILRHKGLFGFISNTFDKTKAAVNLRDYLKGKIEFINYIDFTDVQIFEGATTYPIILIAVNSRTDNIFFNYIKIPRKKKSGIFEIDSELSIQVQQNSLDSESWNFNSIYGAKLLDKLKGLKELRKQYGKCYRGIVTGFNDAFIIDKSTKQRLEKEHNSSKELIKPFLEGKDQSKWHSFEIDKYILFTRRGTAIENYPAIKKYLETNKERLTPRNSFEQKIGRKPGSYKWFEIQDSVDYYKIFESPKITWPNLQANNKFSLDYNSYYINAPSVIFPSDNKTLLCILNSKITWFFLKSICVVRSGGYIEVKPQYFEQIPIPEIKNEEAFNQKADEIINYTSKLQNIRSNFINLLQSKYDIDKLSKKLQNWHELEFKEFLKELKKAKVQLSLSEEAEWMQYFNEQKQKAQELKAEIEKTDKEIDQMVYELYGLTEEEIRIVENS